MANLFGTLNRFISRLDSDPNAPTTATAQNTPSNTHYGFQILRNTNSQLPLDPWFDYIIGINNHNISHPSPQLLQTEIANCAGSTISLGIYTAKGSTIREVYVTVPPAGESLGLSLQWAPLSGAEDVWHILDVMPNSPADVAGLLPYSDYVIGSPDSTNIPLHGDAALGHLVEAFLDQPLRLWVYNQEYDVTRLVTLTPAKNWGGEGSLGCVLGYGALHRIPAPLTEGSMAAPGETLFETGGGDAYSTQTPMEGANADGGFLIPANIQPSTSPGPPKGPPGGKARKARAHHAPTAELDDYFAEGEQKSRELEGTGRSTPKKDSSLPPPPPKSGGPPKAGTAES